MPHPFQKPLGWVARYFYNVEHGHIPFPTPVLDVNIDWPLDYLFTTVTQISVMGGNAFTAFTMGPENHGYLVYLTLEGAVATDVTQVNLESVVPTGSTVRSQRLYTWVSPANFGLQAIVGGMRVGAAQTDPLQYGLPPVYIPPDFKISFSVDAAGAGQNLIAKSVVLQRLKSYPLRLP